MLNDLISARLMLLAKRLDWRSYNSGINSQGKYFIEYETTKKIEQIQFESIVDLEAHIDNLIAKTAESKQDFA